MQLHGVKNEKLILSKAFEIFLSKRTSVHMYCRSYFRLNSFQFTRWCIVYDINMGTSVNVTVFPRELPLGCRGIGAQRGRRSRSLRKILVINLWTYCNTRRHSTTPPLFHGTWGWTTRFILPCSHHNRYAFVNLLRILPLILLAFSIHQHLYIYSSSF